MIYVLWLDVLYKITGDDVSWIGGENEYTNDVINILSFSNSDYDVEIINTPADICGRLVILG